MGDFLCKEWYIFKKGEVKNKRDTVEAMKMIPKTLYMKKLYK